MPEPVMLLSTEEMRAELGEGIGEITFSQDI
jgi:hypothetical protein